MTRSRGRAVRQLSEERRRSGRSAHLFRRSFARSRLSTTASPGASLTRGRIRWLAPARRPLAAEFDGWLSHVARERFWTDAGATRSLARASGRSLSPLNRPLSRDCSSLGRTNERSPVLLEQWGIRCGRRMKSPVAPGAQTRTGRPCSVARTFSRPDINSRRAIGFLIRAIVGDGAAPTPERAATPATADPRTLVRSAGAPRRLHPWRYERPSAPPRQFHGSGRCSIHGPPVDGRHQRSGDHAHGRESYRAPKLGYGRSHLRCLLPRARPRPRRPRVRPPSQQRTGRAAPASG